MPNLAAAHTIYRADYTAPPFLIDAIELDFELEPQCTTVINTMQVRRNPEANYSPKLQLDGEALQLISLHVDGMPYKNVQIDETGLTLYEVPDAFELTIINTCKPASNTSLMGLYLSNSHFFTQCEAQGFRKITYFLDRPDVMARYTVTLRANKTAYPILLSNGNLVEAGDLANGKHYAKWHDPFAKPSYLFALVAAQLVALEERIVTRSGAQKLLQVWVAAHDLDKTRHAMDSLIHAIQWDEARFGLELDLERFMLVAVSDFNMGAMENKGLNIFNTQYVLANPQTATDIDYANIEAVVGHEYFHNWTGNRVTCRDWFQLSLKEGLTVFRDQEFSADMAAADAVNASAARANQRIENVRILQQTQFTEDAGPMAHPVRPESYVEINNFYTTTVYEKGAEVVRMYQTLLGREGFRQGMDLYFQRHDGQAVTCDDFRQAMADANQRDLTQFEGWYSQPGTPYVSVQTHYDEAAQTYAVTLAQYYKPVLNAPQVDCAPLLIPFALGLVDTNGQDLALQLDNENTPGAETRILELSKAAQTFCFINVRRRPVPSLLRDFSAPVMVEYDYTDDELIFLLAHDSDPFNRWAAGQQLATRILLAHARQTEAIQLKVHEANPSLIEAFGCVLRNPTLTPAFRAQVLTLPTEAYLAEQMEEANPAAVHTARQNLRIQLANALSDDWFAIYAQHQTPGPYQPTPAAIGQRALKNLALSYLTDSEHTERTLHLAQMQYATANNMSDRSAALSALIHLGGKPAQAALTDFYQRFENEPLAIDKWFAFQAKQTRAEMDVIHVVRTLLHHPAFTSKNPNRVRALIFSFISGNPAQFHAPHGAGYTLWAEQVLALDTLNPQLAARLARLLERWRKFVPPLREKMHRALTTVLASAQSKDVREIIHKALLSAPKE
ncbi:aminopeptidase N [Mycoavidus sp. B2-EB]|uniref:aminopeptidase N n=1 Tax=Mycoavidus sp. B2-EB TaxID=2651972 RepID=UPI0016273AB9|nr:aminopeptidase N [Mycoavidus sp. B2-EB]BBO59521.1 aminopeptidase N [Mycoavidus sp. B2-EB]